MIKFSEFRNLPVLDAVLIVSEDGFFDLHEGRKWISGRFDRNIGIDQPTSGAGQTHAHIYGRKNDELVVVNFDGSSSHGTKGKISDADADALIARGFKLPAGNIVEWFSIPDQPQLLLE